MQKTRLQPIHRLADPAARHIIIIGDGALQLGIAGQPVFKIVGIGAAILGGEIASAIVVQREYACFSVRDLFILVEFICRLTRQRGGAIVNGLRKVRHVFRLQGIQQIGRGEPLAGAIAIIPAQGRSPLLAQNAMSKRVDQAVRVIADRERGIVQKTCARQPGLDACPGLEPGS